MFALQLIGGPLLPGNGLRTATRGRSHTRARAWVGLRFSVLDKSENGCPELSGVPLGDREYKYQYDNISEIWRVQILLKRQ
jgi:hypothetical protein